MPSPVPAKAPASTRLLACVLACACFAVLFIASRLHADPAGHGTHTQLSLPPCGWVAGFNRPCFSCGMTTAFTHAAHANYTNAFITHPFGMAAALAAAATFWGSLHVAMTGSQLASLAGRALRPRTLTLIALAGAASWAYKWITWPI